MPAFFTVTGATFFLVVFLSSPSLTSPHLHNFINNNRPAALLLPNGKIVRSPHSPEYDPQNLKPSLPDLKPSKGSICSLLKANFSNQRRKGFAEVQSRVHGINNRIPFRPSRHIQPVWSCSANSEKFLKYDQNQPIHDQNAQNSFGHSRSRFHNPGTQFSCAMNQPIHDQNAQNSFGHSRSRFHNPGTQFSCTMNQPIHDQNVQQSFDHSESRFHNPGTQFSCTLNQPIHDQNVQHSFGHSRSRFHNPGTQFSCTLNQPIHDQNVQHSFGHSRSRFHNPGTQFSCTMNQHRTNSHPNTNGNKIYFNQLNGLLNSKAQKCFCNNDENRIKPVDYSSENADAGYGNVMSNDRKVESLQFTGSRKFEIAASGSPTQELQYEKSSHHSDSDCGPLWEFSEKNCCYQVVTSNPSKFSLANKDFNSTKKKAGPTSLLRVGDNPMFCASERIHPLADPLPSELGQCLPALHMTPKNSTPKAPWWMACNNCLPIRPWMPPTAPAPGAIVPWCPRMVPPPWTSVSPFFQRKPCHPWSPEIPITPRPVNIAFANHCSPLGPFVPPVTAVTDTMLVYFVVLPTIISSTSAINFFPPEQLNIMEPPELTDLLHFLIVNSIG